MKNKKLALNFLENLSQHETLIFYSGILIQNFIKEDVHILGKIRNNEKPTNLQK